MQFDRLEALIKLRGKTKTHMGKIAGKPNYYLRDCKAKGINIPDDVLKIWADDLGCSVQYLRGETDVMEPVEIKIDLLDDASVDKIKRSIQLGAKSMGPKLSPSGKKRYAVRAVKLAGSSDGIGIASWTKASSAMPKNTFEVASAVGKTRDFWDLYKEISKKESAAADLAEVRRFMEYVARRDKASAKGQHDITIKGKSNG